jgi:hypothetical protein
MSLPDSDRTSSLQFGTDQYDLGGIFVPWREFYFARKLRIGSCLYRILKLDLS